MKSALLLLLITLQANASIQYISDQYHDNECNLFEGIPETVSGQNLLNKSRVERLINRAYVKLGPEFKSAGLKLTIFNHWADNTLNAYAQRDHTKTPVRAEIHLFGGLSRASHMTYDGLAMVLCHEAGHHLGGRPLKNWLGNVDWAASEGQSDYFASLKCMRLMFSDEDNIAVVKKMQINSIARIKCHSMYKNPQDEALCLRSVMAGESLAKTLSALRQDNFPPRITTKDRIKAVSTNVEGYPSLQCRLDTYIAGALCPIKTSVEISLADIFKGQCHPQKVLQGLGARPACWFVD